MIAKKLNQREKNLLGGRAASLRHACSSRTLGSTTSSKTFYSYDIETNLGVHPNRNEHRHNAHVDQGNRGTNGTIINLLREKMKKKKKSDEGIKIFSEMNRGGAFFRQRSQSSNGTQGSLQEMDLCSVHSSTRNQNRSLHNSTLLDSHEMQKALKEAEEKLRNITRNQTNASISLKENRYHSFATLERGKCPLLYRKGITFLKLFLVYGLLSVTVFFSYMGFFSDYEIEERLNGLRHASVSSRAELDVVREKMAHTEAIVQSLKKDMTEVYEQNENIIDELEDRRLLMTGPYFI